jgi:hypothetical protein
VVRRTGEEAADDRWAATAAGYVKAAQNGRCGSWLAEHCPHRPEASHEEAMSGLLADHILTYHQVDIICPQCGRLWRQYEPGGPAHRSFLPEQDRGLADALRRRLRRVPGRFAGGLSRPWHWPGGRRGGARVIPARPRSAAPSSRPLGRATVPGGFLFVPAPPLQARAILVQLPPK